MTMRSSTRDGVPFAAARAHDDPVLVVGMHRSGTTAVTRVLQALGVHMGRFCDENEEPRPLIALNDWILRQAGTTWEYPLAVTRLLEHEATRTATVESVGQAMRSPLVRAIWSRSRGSSVRGGRWGWKDPRTSATLPIWLAVCGRAKVISVHRHGVPVAASLVARHAAARRRPTARHRFLSPFRPGPFLGSRTSTLDDAIEMWKDYESLVARNTGSLGARHLSVRYEDLVVEPKAVADSIAAFVAAGDTATGSIDDRAIAQAAAIVTKSEPFAFRSDPRLASLEDRHRSILADGGYGPGELSATAGNSLTEGHGSVAGRHRSP